MIRRRASNAHLNLNTLLCDSLLSSSRSLLESLTIRSVVLEDLAQVAGSIARFSVEQDPTSRGRGTIFGIVVLDTGIKSAVQEILTGRRKDGSREGRSWN